MNRNNLIERLKQYQAEYDQTVANANAIKGAMQDIQYWLTQVDPLQVEEVKSAKSKKPTVIATADSKEL